MTKQTVTRSPSTPVIREKNHFCPECGEFVVRLNLVTGWCSSCTSQIENNTLECGRCGRTKTATGKYGKLVCPYCKVEDFLAKNADHIEHYMCEGATFTRALEKLQAEVRPFCACCGGVMTRSRRTAVFCRATESCKKAARRYNYLIQNKGMEKPNALNQVLSELDGDN